MTSAFTSIAAWTTQDEISELWSIPLNSDLVSSARMWQMTCGTASQSSIRPISRLSSAVREDRPKRARYPQTYKDTTPRRGSFLLSHGLGFRNACITDTPDIRGPEGKIVVLHGHVYCFSPRTHACLNTSAVYTLWRRYFCYGKSTPARIPLSRYDQTILTGACSKITITQIWDRTARSSG